MNNELAHHGILGMKWGVRRYQNKDGTLTVAGRKRYADGGKAKNTSSKIGTLTVAGRKRYADGGKAKNTNLKAEEQKIVKKASSMTDKELEKAIARMKLEESYNDCLSKLSLKKKSAGKDFVADILKTSTKNIGTQLVTYAMGTAVNKIFEGDIVNPKKGQ